MIVHTHVGVGRECWLGFYQALTGLFFDAETTLMKLKQGSRHVQSSPAEESHISPSGTVMTIDVHSVPTSISPSSSECQSMGTSKDQRYTNVSVVYLFSKYKSSQRALSSPDNEAMATESGCSSESDISTSSSDCQLMSSTRQQLKQGCVSSSSVFLNV